jgi:hypothetical protein
MQYKPKIYGDETVWVNSTAHRNGDAMGTEVAYLAVHQGLKFCRDLANTSICICSDNAPVLKQLRGELAVPRGTKLHVLHAEAATLIKQITRAGNRISFCLIPSSTNQGMAAVANRAIDDVIGAEDKLEEVDGDSEPEEALARSVLGVVRSDPTLLSLQEMKEGWGGCLNFMLSYGLKPWKAEDVKEALAISRAMKKVRCAFLSKACALSYFTSRHACTLFLASGCGVDAEKGEAETPPLEHLEPLRDATDEALTDLPPLEPLFLKESILSVMFVFWLVRALLVLSSAVCLIWQRLARSAQQTHRTPRTALCPSCPSP